MGMITDTVKTASLVAFGISLIFLIGFFATVSTTNINEAQLISFVYLGMTQTEIFINFFLWFIFALGLYYLSHMTKSGGTVQIRY